MNLTIFDINITFEGHHKDLKSKIENLERSAESKIPKNIQGKISC
jgi:hypothetical protein